MPTFRHLLRFSQKRAIRSSCLLLVMCVPMHLRSKVLRQGVAMHPAHGGRISELAQNRLAIGVGYSANACGGDAVTTGAARAARSTVSAVAHQASPKPPHYLTSDAVREFRGKWMFERLAGGYPSTGAALPVSRKLPGRGLLLSGWGEHNARYRAGTFLWALFCAAAVAYWRRCVANRQQRQAPAWLAS